MQMKISIVTGPIRSGKTTYLQQLIKEKKLYDDKNEEATLIFAQKTELENKLEKLIREIKLKEKDHAQFFLLENQKLLRVATEKEDEQKAKDQKISNLEKQIEQLNFQISQKNHELSNLNAEHNKEITKFTIELDRCKSKKNGQENRRSIEPDMNIKFLFKSIQSNFTEFKDSLERLDKEKESIFKFKYLELTAKEMDNTSKDWISEIKSFKTEQINQLNENYKTSILNLRNEFEDSQMNVTRLQYKLDEEVQLNEMMKNKLEVL